MLLCLEKLLWKLHKKICSKTTNTPRWNPEKYSSNVQDPRGTKGRETEDIMKKQILKWLT